MASEYFTSMTLDFDSVLRDLKPCDIVEFNRIVYSHYAFHIGDGIFVHVTGDGKEETKSLKGTKCAQTLRQIAGKSPCRINNLEAAKFWKFAGGDGQPPKKRSVSEARRLAFEGLTLDENGEPKLGLEYGKTVPYHLMGWNCERYCTYWKYEGDGFSQQAYNGFFSSTLGNGQRLCDLSAAAYFKATEEAPIVVKPLLAAGGVITKTAGVAIGTTKAVTDGAVSVLTGAVEGVFGLFR